MRLQARCSKSRTHASLRGLPSAPRPPNNINLPWPHSCNANCCVKQRGACSCHLKAMGLYATNYKERDVHAPCANVLMGQQAGRQQSIAACAFWSRMSVVHQHTWNMAFMRGAGLRPLMSKDEALMVEGPPSISSSSKSPFMTSLASASTPLPPKTTTKRF